MAKRTRWKVVILGNVPDDPELETVLEQILGYERRITTARSHMRRARTVRSRRWSASASRSRSGTSSSAKS
jgi:hypothetical protein